MDDAKWEVPHVDVNKCVSIASFPIIELSSATARRSLFSSSDPLRLHNQLANYRGEENFEVLVSYIHLVASEQVSLDVSDHRCLKLRHSEHSHLEIDEVWTFLDDAAVYPLLYCIWLDTRPL